jgi:outer membrane protein OmpA-like peptidoglycan-associated protein
MFDRSVGRLAGTIAMGVLVAALAGCATKGFVKQQIASSEARTMPLTEQAANQARDAKTFAVGVDERARQAQTQAQFAHDLALGNIKREEVRKVTVTFPFDSAELGEDTRSALDGVSADLKSNVNYLALITGYTDASGDDTYNVGLSQRRAEAVHIYLGQQLGTDFVRLATIGFGNLQPVADNSTREGRAQNRRTEVVIVRPAPALNEGQPPTAQR